MDPISVAIIVTVLSVGSVLVYLFQSDYERRQTSKLQQTVAKKAASKPQNAKLQVSKSKQVPSDIAQASPQTTTSNSAAGSNVPVQVKSQFKSNQAGAKANKRKENIEPAISSKVPLDEPRGTEPSFDELDSSVLLSAFSQSHAKTAPKPPAKRSHSPLADKRTSRKVQQSQSCNYSLEQLFNIIAASSLTKEEVELAIETLLNKVESGQADWKQPKSDPLRRLKSQLRDSELALQTEIQNHEHTRAHLIELKSQLQGERASSNSMKEELSKLRKEISFVKMALDQTRDDLAKQQTRRKNLNEESALMIRQLEQDKAQLKTMLANTSLNESEICKLRDELNDTKNQIQRYELSNHAMADEVQKLESKLCQAELQVDQLRSSKQHDDYEACAKLTELESDRSRLEKTVKDHVARLRELSDTNNLLEKSVKELQLINTRQEDMLKRLRDERHVNEASMKRTLCEMEQELKELHKKLSANSASHDERLRKEISQAERELSDADQRQQKLQTDMKELRDGLTALLPIDVKPNLPEKLNGHAENWIQQYLAAFKQLCQTLEDLKRESNNINNNNNNNNNNDSPSKITIDKSTSTLHSNGNYSRVGSPTSNGRSSRTGSHKDHDNDKKRVAETKLLELNEYIEKLEDENRKLESEKKTISSQIESSVQQQIKELTLQRNKLEAQIKFGLDSLKMEQERARRLEEELAKYTDCVQTIQS